MTASLEQLVSVQGLFCSGLLPYLSAQDLCRLESTSSAFLHLLRAHDYDTTCWKILCQRDYYISSNAPKASPIFNPENRSFGDLVPQTSWKFCYQQWTHWNKYTGRRIKPEHMVTSIILWRRFKAFLEHHSLQNILTSLQPCPAPQVFQYLDAKFPSSLLAFYAVHGGQQSYTPSADFFAGFFGTYSCYGDFYSMRVEDIAAALNESVMQDSILIAKSPGNPHMFLHVLPTEQDPQGQIILAPLGQEVHYHHGEASLSVVVGHGGILSYFQEYVKRLEAGIYTPSLAIPNHASSRGIGLFPDEGDLVSSCVTRGIQVKASARWFPSSMMGNIQGGLNFGYSIRIRMVETIETTTCQLVSRHWQFMDGKGTIRTVDGEGVIGKQPLFFMNGGKSGYVDLGPAGIGSTYTDTAFVYQSQSGPVMETTQVDTKLASVQGTFSFIPGSIAEPRGALFHVTVEKFPLAVCSPFY